MKDYCLRIGRASDIENKRERLIYRFFEMLPGILSWLTLILTVLVSWKKPIWAAIFIIFFVIYYLFRTIYFSVHLSACYKQMRINEKIDWIEKINQLPDNLKREIYHLIIFPAYKESLEILRDSFKSLINSDWPKDKMIVVLSYEEKGGRETEKTAKTIESEFKNIFFRFLITSHPGNLPGEIPGKGSNETWGVKEVKEKAIDRLKIPYKNIIVSAFDADTCVFPKYFSCLTYHYLNSKDPYHLSFQPIPLFINNIWQTPPISRIFSFAASFWEMMCLERPEKLITFSSHAMSLKTLVEVGFKQTNVVSEDSRIFWQCFLKYDGNYQVVPIYYPVSMDANVASTFLKTMKNVYRQQRRWAYGAENVAYFLFGFLKNKKIPLPKKFSLGFATFENYWSWATNSIIIFLLGWLPITIGGEEFRQTLLSHNLPIFISRILTIGMIGLVLSAIFSILLLSPKIIDIGRKKYLFLILEWFLMPVIMIFFYAIPALDAQTRLMAGKYLGFWPTEKVRKPR